MAAGERFQNVDWEDDEELRNDIKKYVELEKGRGFGFSKARLSTICLEPSYAK